MTTNSIIRPSFISLGATRHPSASAWGRSSGILAFGAGRTIAIWKPESDTHVGIIATLKGHTQKINAVRFLPGRHISNEIIISAGEDKTIRIWRRKTFDGEVQFDLVATEGAHDMSISHVGVAEIVNEQSTIFATASADGTVKVWSLEGLDTSEVGVSIATTVRHVQTLNMKPKFIPLAVALAQLTSTAWLLAVAGSTSAIQIYVSSTPDINFSYAATLTGHENWVRSLTFVTEKGGDLLLASASQDKYVRLWRVHRGKDVPAQSSGSGELIMGNTLSNKAHRFVSEEQDYTMTFEALLVGHEDWVYTVDWKTSPNGTLQLLTSSADNSLSIWEPEEESGIWTCIARLGEISTSKGSSTATGSAGGFWNGMWSPDGRSVVSLGKTGSWRRWSYDEKEDRWVQAASISGHVRDVTGIAWASGGEYLLSTGLDQSTRLYARWMDSPSKSWHEFARPQIHGYDINCIASISPSCFVSGADEKLLRVFDEPKTIAGLLEKLCHIKPSAVSMPDAANVPVLSLSNKAIATTDNTDLPKDAGHGQEAIDPASTQSSSTLDINIPPLEGHLSRHTLWPESEKLYGHGYEISAVASVSDLVATACRATTTEHAVIRLFETENWRQVKPNLELHGLTVTSLEFSEDGKYLLSVGRDRQWAVFHRKDITSHEFTLLKAMPKAHTRMILDGKWCGGNTFATASRDKCVKFWNLDGENIATIKLEEAVTAIEFDVTASADGQMYMVAGTESGALWLYSGNADKHEWTIVERLRNGIVPDKAITQIAWNPCKREFAVSSEDATVRIFEFEVDLDLGS